MNKELTGKQRLQRSKRFKIWFGNIVLVFMWSVSVLLEANPWFTIPQTLSIVFYTITGGVPIFIMYEVKGIWKTYGVEVEVPEQMEHNHIKPDEPK